MMNAARALRMILKAEERNAKEILAKRSTKISAEPSSTDPAETVNLNGHSARLEDSLVAPRDVDGNLIFVEDGEAFIMDASGDRYAVDVFKATVPDDKTEQCTVLNPDGNVEVLISRPKPSIGNKHRKAVNIWKWAD